VNTIFISTLAKAVIKASYKKLSPGIYSLVNNPQWTLLQIYEYYKRYYLLHNNIIFITKREASLKQRVKNSSIKALKNYRSLFESFFLIRDKKLYATIKGKYRILNVKASMQQTVVNTFTDFHLLGKNPGKLINDLPCSIDIVFDQEKNMEALYNQFLMKNTVEHS
jgi:hypothetical protein